MSSLRTGDNQQLDGSSCVIPAAQSSFIGGCRRHVFEISPRPGR
ncbi:hypothetical protein FGIG_07382 [Fasciola gigantica]|uniref:Uncharacterized protein n=1 Tax=Fasciola gigantica TaxID=46835 RepID=A0A504YYX8_FASGI|nr:hypothetical protein FGIG_07382 [Fasciola gigantica]